MVNSHRPKQILLRRDAADLHSQLSQWKEVISIVQENAQQKGFHDSRNFQWFCSLFDKPTFTPIEGFKSPSVFRFKFFIEIIFYRRWWVRPRIITSYFVIWIWFRHVRLYFTSFCFVTIFHSHMWSKQNQTKWGLWFYPSLVVTSERIFFHTLTYSNYHSQFQSGGQRKDFNEDSSDLCWENKLLRIKFDILLLYWVVAWRKRNVKIYCQCPLRNYF